MVDPAVEGYVSYVCRSSGKRIRPALALLAGGVKLESGRRFNVTWLVLILTAMLGNGMLMTISKYHQRILSGKDVGEFLIVAFATATLASAFLAIRCHRPFSAYDRSAAPGSAPAPQGACAGSPLERSRARPAASGP